MSAQIHRFGNKIALSLGTGETFYLSPFDAKRIAKFLAEYAKDVEKNSFAKSKIGTIGMTIETDFRN
jgi:hypothetical protein